MTEERRFLVEMLIMKGEPLEVKKRLWNHKYYRSFTPLDAWVSIHFSAVPASELGELVSLMPDIAQVTISFSDTMLV